jgi:hypothetical protein
LGVGRGKMALAEKVTKITTGCTVETHCTGSGPALLRSPTQRPGDLMSRLFPALFCGSNGGNLGALRCSYYLFRPIMCAHFSLNHQTLRVDWVGHYEPTRWLSLCSQGLAQCCARGRCRLTPVAAVPRTSPGRAVGVGASRCFVWMQPRSAPQNMLP